MNSNFSRQGREFLAAILKPIIVAVFTASHPAPGTDTYRPTVTETRPVPGIFECGDDSVQRGV